MALKGKFYKHRYFALTAYLSTTYYYVVDDNHKYRYWISYYTQSSDKNRWAISPTKWCHRKSVISTLAGAGCLLDASPLEILIICGKIPMEIE